MTWRKPLISGFILVYIYTAILLAWPTTRPWKSTLLAPVQPTLMYFGVYHDLNLFGAAPKRSQRATFLVTFDDGTTAPWAFPRSKMSPEDSPDSYVRYVTNYLYTSKNARSYRYKKTGKSPTMMSLARYVARQNDSPQRHPISIKFIMIWCDTFPPAEGIGRPRAEMINTNEVYEYDVQEGDLP